MTAAVVFIDLQSGYFEDPDLARIREPLVEEANRLAAAARERGFAIYHVITEHARDKSTWTLSMLDDDQGFNFVGTEQAAPLGELDLDDANQLSKIRDSAFFGTSLAQRLRIGGAERIAIAGVSGQNCINRTGSDAFAENFRVAYARDAIGSENPERCREALDMLSKELRQPILGTDELMDWLAQA
ncbi:cysteine hydrolase [Zhihengliuella alba]|uniref:Cysteine hydrolase n=1 Tax=Zhihengliuella alba TaxID=547018 RepID=A0ABP7D8D7_9MICC